MKLAPRLALVLTPFAAYAAVAPDVAAANVEEVTVELAGGRRFTAAVDERTDEQHLWLRFDGTSTTLWRPVAWGRVRGGRYRGEAISADRLRDVARRIRSEAPPREPGWAADPPSADPAGPSYAERFRQSLAGRRSVRSLRVNAEAANWDRDADLDGVRLHVQPAGADGGIVPVDATLYVELTGVRPAALPARFAFPRGRPFPQIGSWVRHLRAEDFAPGGAVVELPFQDVVPREHDELAPFGTVDARLVVPGQGVFEASLNGVRIREFQPYGG